jgi:hypothetical protein
VLCIQNSEGGVVHLVKTNIYTDGYHPRGVLIKLGVLFKTCNKKKKKKKIKDASRTYFMVLILPIGLLLSGKHTCIKEYMCLIL